MTNIRQEEISLPKEASPNFEPIFGKVVIKIDRDAERRYGNLVLPQQEAARSTMGTVFAVYKAMETPEGFVEPQVKVGDKVVFGQFVGTLLTISREIYVVCREHDLLTIVHFDEEEGVIPRVEELID